MRDDILRMAREAGFVLYDMHDVDGQDLGESVEADDHGALERFAALVAAAEREACAKECDDLARLHRDDNPDSAAWEWGECAAAIRARKDA